MSLKDYSAFDQTEGEPAIPLLLVAPSLPLRAGLRTILDATADFEVMAESGSLEEVHPYLEDASLLVLVDQPLLSADLDRLLQLRSDLAFLLLVRDTPALSSQFIDMPGIIWGVLPLDSTAETLFAALHALHEGLIVSPPTFIKQLFTTNIVDEEIERTNSWKQIGAEPLTERENQVLQLLAGGLANKQIGYELGISEHTVKFHISAVYAKLEASNRAEAVRIGVKRGLITV
jgi:DNA-binding NarL/FixJ family response regulator